MKPFVVIDDALLDSVTRQARQSPRLRMNRNFHRQESDPVNRLLNAMEPGTYVRPHRHARPDKDDIVVVLRGAVKAFLFDDAGQVTEAVVLSPRSGRYGMEIAAGAWHSLIVLEPGTVLYEVKEGPYAPLAPENLAPWAPDGADPEAVDRYVAALSAL